MRMVDAYEFNEQKSWLPTRKLMALIVNVMASEDDEPIMEDEIFWLPMIDRKEPEIIESEQPIKLSPEEIQQLKKRDGIL